MGDQKLETVEFFKYLSSRVTNDARSKCEIISRFAMATQHSTRRRFFFHQQSGLKFKQKLGKCYTWSIALYCAELGHLDSSSEIPVKFCNTVLEKAREGHWTDRVKNGKLFQSQE